MKVGVVLDVTAVLAYARLEGLAVGELIGVVQDDGDITGIPVLVLVDAWPQLEPREQGHIRRLVGQVDPPAEILPLTADFVDVVAPLVATHGHAVAQTIAASRAVDAAVATFASEIYEGDLDKDAILPLEE